MAPRVASSLATLTVAPRVASSLATVAATVLLPTPPLPLSTNTLFRIEDNLSAIRAASVGQKTFESSRGANET